MTGLGWWIGVLAPGLLLVTGVAGVARADTLIDGGSGLKVDAPPGYVASVHQPPAGSSVPGMRIDVKKDGDRDTGCRASYSPAPQNAALSQKDINATVRTPGWQEKVKRTLSGLYDIRSEQIVDVRGVATVVIVGDFKDTPGAAGSARMKEVRTWLAMEETPRGRTSLSCVGDKAGFEARALEFRAVLEGITVP